MIDFFIQEEEERLREEEEEAERLRLEEEEKNKQKPKRELIWPYARKKEEIKKVAKMRIRMKHFAKWVEFEQVTMIAKYALANSSSREIRRRKTRNYSVLTFRDDLE